MIEKTVIMLIKLSHDRLTLVENKGNNDKIEDQKPILVIDQFFEIDLLLIKN